MIAVITSDIIDYTKLSEKKANVLLNSLHSIFKEISNVATNLNTKFSIKRGDTIQCELENYIDSLKIALLLKTAVNKVSLDAKLKRPSVDLRIAIGIGNIKIRRTNIDESSGDAYTNSGRTLDSMKKNKRQIAIKTSDKELDAELETEFKLLEIIMSGWKRTSAEVLYLLLLGYNEKQIAQKLNISQPAINQRKKTMGWNGINALLIRYENLMKTKWI